MVEDMGGEFGTNEQPEPDEDLITSPATSKSRSRARGAAAGVGVALVVGVGGIAVATSGSASPGAASPSPSAKATTSAAPTPAPTKPDGQHRGGPGRPMGGFGMRGLAGGPFGAVVHGIYVIAKPGGGYQTMQTQTGTVKSVSSTSLSVTSKDGFSFTYVVKAGTNVDADRDGIASVKKGDQVSVTATLSGKTGTVVRVLDITQLQKNAPKFHGGPGGIPGHSPSPGTGT